MDVLGTSDNQETVYVPMFTGHFIEIIWMRSFKK